MSESPELPCLPNPTEQLDAEKKRVPADEFGNGPREIRMVAMAAHARGDYKAERLALDRLAVMERDACSGGDGDRCRRATTDPHGFRWVGQSFASCDGCGQPYWEHDYDERPGPGSGPFDARWVYVPITDEQKAAAKARWQR
jgi:hypothetical protein